MLANRTSPRRRAAWFASQDGGTESPNGRIAHDSGAEDPAEWVTAAVGALERTGQDVTTMTAALDSAHGAYAGLKAA